MLIASEGALWGAIRHQGLLQDTVIVSDDAGQFRVGVHALCWVHAERLVHKLVPTNDKQRNAIEVAKRMIWWFYRSLKEYKLAPSPEQAQVLRARFDRIFKRGSTGYVTLDRLLRRLFATRTVCCAFSNGRKSPQHQRFRKRHPRLRHEKKNLRRNRQEKGRDARDIMLGLAKTCMKLKLSFYEFLGDRLGVTGPKIPPLATYRPPPPEPTQLARKSAPIT